MVPTFAASLPGIPAMTEGIKRWTRSTRAGRSAPATSPGSGEHREPAFHADDQSKPGTPLVGPGPFGVSSRQILGYVLGSPYLVLTNPVIQPLIEDQRWPR